MTNKERIARLEGIIEAIRTELTNLRTELANLRTEIRSTRNTLLMVIYCCGLPPLGLWSGFS
jgi:septal ring factor EnvC (AmiA/AmiB activator)